MRFDYIQRRLEWLEARLINCSGPWPPAEGSFSYLLWDAFGRSEERCSYLDMYLQASQKFYEGEHEPRLRPY